ncbi:MAG: hypothetical protein CVU39_01020 [Chloroflexi bacterium HGW-Chloroflexi-10]|nr:MAG: hypothetical protein CVU39_01020 [Chloroflexi bacterium HGW-Chloroflexi-10]
MAFSEANPVVFYVFVAVACFMTGFSKAGFGGLMGPVVTVLMSLVMPINQVLGLLLPILMVGDLFAVTAHWRNWNTRLLLVLLPGAVLGVIAGMYFMQSVPVTFMKRTLGVLVLIFVILRFVEGVVKQRVQGKAPLWYGVPLGMMTGFSSSLAHAGPSPISIFLLTQQVGPVQFVGTMVAFFTITNWIKLPFYWVNGMVNPALITKIIWLLPVVLLGVWVGRKLSRRVDKVLFDRIILVFLALTAILLLIQ